MKLNEKELNSIAQDIQMGLAVFFHKITHEIVVLPGDQFLFYDTESWQESIDKVENDRTSYIRVDQMSSCDSFNVMEKFAYSIPDEKFKEKLLNVLEKRKPFRNFKYEIDESDYREDWFAFRDKANMEHVQQMIDWGFSDHDEEE